MKRRCRRKASRRHFRQAAISQPQLRELKALGESELLHREARPFLVVGRVDRRSEAALALVPDVADWIVTRVPSRTTPSLAASRRGASRSTVGVRIRTTSRSRGESSTCAGSMTVIATVAVGAGAGSTVRTQPTSANANKLLIGSATVQGHCRV
jgi:hypothetical protein